MLGSIKFWGIYSSIDEINMDLSFKTISQFVLK